MSNYREIPYLLRNREPFSGNSMSAFTDAQTGDYVVLSYNTEIARVTSAGVKTVNTSKYSTTTSRHQNLVAATL